MDLPYRDTIRLKNYDYSSPGWYYVTICTQNQQCILGNIIDNKMKLNKHGEIVETIIKKLPKRYERLTMDVWQVMPNHAHMIIIIKPPVGAIHESPDSKIHESPDSKIHESPDSNKDKRAHHDAPLQFSKRRFLKNGDKRQLLPKCIGYLKMNTTNQISHLHKNWHKRIWQRNYYEHIIRNEKSLFKIRNYIKSNPIKWEIDEYNPRNL